LQKLEQENEEQDKTIKLLVEENNWLRKVVSEAHPYSDPPIAVPRNDSGTLVRAFGTREKAVDSTYGSFHKSKRGGHIISEY
jgi:hypothetical protein